MAGESNHKRGYEFQGQAISRQQRAGRSPGPKVDPANHTDKQTGYRSQDEVEEQDAF